MPRHSHSLFDSFQEKGYWWLPQSPDKQIPGMLFHTETDTTLELFGDFKEETLADLGVLRQQEATPIILGYGEDSVPVTLLRCHCTGRRLSLPGSVVVSKWSAKEMLVGKYYNNPEDILFTAMDVNFTNMEEWVGRRPFTTEWSIDSGGRRIAGHQTTYTQPDPITFEIPTLDATLSIECRGQFGGSFTSPKHEYFEYVSLTPKTPRPFRWFQTAFNDCAALLTLLIGSPIYEKQIGARAKREPTSAEESARTHPDEDHVVIFIHYRNRIQKENKLPPEMLIALPMMDGWYAETFKRWFEKESALRDVYNLYFGTVYSPGPFLQTEFLSLIQAVESFSRTRGDDFHIPVKEYEPIRDKMLEAIPSDVSKGLRESLQGAINFGNQLSLKKRLDKILTSLDPETLKMFCPDIQVFKKKVADTRNYLAHFDMKSKDKALQGKALFVYNLRLRLLLTILLLKEVCVKEASLRECFNQHNEWLQLIHLYTARPEY
jgi:hypothetical protein